MSAARSLSDTGQASVKPVGSADRYLALDALRGIALFGVLMINDLDFFRVSMFGQRYAMFAERGWANRVVDVLATSLLEFKAFTIFSFLFGVGLGVQIERLGLRETSGSRFLARRLLVLLGMGLVHLSLVSNVDILALYAFCGLLLLPLIHVATRWLASLGLVSIVLTFVLPLYELIPSVEVMQAHAVVATEVYATGSWHEIFLIRWLETTQFLLPMFLTVLPQTVGLMLLGIAAWQLGIFQHPEQHRSKLVAVALTGGALGAAATTVVVLQKWHGPTWLANVPPALVNACSYIPLAGSYVAMFLLGTTKPRGGIAMRSLAAVGQLSLTNYLLQSVILSLIFYSYGGGLFGQLDSLPAASLGVLIYLGQIWFSRWWLGRYRFGPAEWLWRTLTYGQLQPLRINNPQALPITPPRD